MQNESVIKKIDRKKNLKNIAHKTYFDMGVIMTYLILKYEG